MSLLQQGYQLTYYLENPPEEGKLTLSKPNDDSITGGCVNPCGHLELRLTLSSDQIPADLTDYYNVLYPPDFNGPRGTADVYSADVRAFMQNILTAYTTLLREYELNPPETTPDITVTNTTNTVNVRNVEPTRLYGPQPGFIFSTNTDYLELVPTKLIALAVFPDLPLEEIPTDITEYFAKFFPDQSLTDTYSDEQIAQLQGALDSFIASRKADTTTDPSYNLEYNSDPKNTTITLPTGRVVKLSDDILLTHSLSDEQLDLSQPYLYRISDYINPETGRLEDLPIPLIVFKNDDSADTTVTDTTNTDDYFFQDVPMTPPALQNLTGPVVYLNFVDKEAWSERKMASIADVVAMDYLKYQLNMVTEKPAEGEFYTICVGSAQALQDYAASQGLVYDPESPNASSGIGFAVAEKKNSADFLVEQDIILSIGDQLSILLADECPGISDYCPVTVFSDSTTDTTVTDTAALIAGLKSYLEEIAPKMSDIDSLTDEEVASFNETLKSYKEALRQAGVATCLADTTLDPRTDTGMNPETFDPRTDTSLTALLDSYIAALDEKEAKTAGTTSDFYPYPISTNNVTFVVNPDRNLPDQLVCWVTKPQTDSAPMAFISTMDAETEAVTSVQVACAEDGGWRTIGTLNNPDGIDWKYQAGNLTGSGTASVVWHAQELGALGVWTDGTDNWTAVDGWFDTNWTMLGCGDFDGDGKDSVLMSLNGGLFYSVDLDGTLTSLGGLNWSGWEFGAVGDFAGDGKDDIVLLHRESGTVVMLADGNADAFERLGQLDATDWSVAGAGDFDADGKDDLLVRQNSTGIAGAYASADMSKWSTVSSDYLLA
jgi:hypothetical protein